MSQFNKSLKEHESCIRLEITLAKKIINVFNYCFALFYYFIALIFYALFPFEICKKGVMDAVFTFYWYDFYTTH